MGERLCFFLYKNFSIKIYNIRVFEEKPCCWLNVFEEINIKK